MSEASVIRAATPSGWLVVLANRHVRRRLRLTVVFCLLVAGSLAFLLPLYWQVSTSLKTEAQIYSGAPFALPKPILWDNYPNALRAFNFLRYLLNTCLMTFPPTILTLLSSSFVAYSFARIRWRGRDVWFIVVLSSMMLPGWVTLIPLYILYSRLGWINTYLPWIVPALLGGGAFNIFLLRQFMLTIPEELTDAAKVDGCGHIRIWWNIILPLCGPALATVAVFSFVLHWNDFFGPMILLNDEDLFPLQVGLWSFKTQYSANYPHMMAVATVVMLPVLVVFFIAQRYLIEGITLTGLKG